MSSDYVVWLGIVFHLYFSIHYCTHIIEITYRAAVGLPLVVVLNYLFLVTGIDQV